MAFGNGYTIAFAAGVCVVCSTVLSVLSMGLAEQQDDNRRRDLYKNIMVAVDLPEEVDGVRPTLSGPEIDALWAEKIELRAISSTTGEPVSAEEADVNGDGTFDYLDLQGESGAARARGCNPPPKKDEVAPEILGVYVRKDTGTIALPMTGKGLWGPISAYVAFDTKLTKVTGTTFFAPKETPGLGAEITNPKFKEPWVGKSIIEGGSTTPIRVLKPSECAEQTDTHCVDGVSGATITSRGVDKMMTKTLNWYEPYIQKVRQ